MYFPGRRGRLFAFLYFCEGAPIGFVWWALPAYWSHAGVPVERVTLVTAAAVIPWSLKWLWAPLVDLTAARIGYFPWVLATQLMMGLALWPIVWLDPSNQLAWSSLLSLVLLNILLGVIDVAPADAWSIRLALIVVVYAVVGVFTASSYALFMAVAHGPWQATIFRALMGLTNACKAGSALAAGQLASALGYPAAFVMMTVPSLLGLAILPLLRRRS